MHTPRHVFDFVSNARGWTNTAEVQRARSTVNDWPFGQPFDDFDSPVFSDRLLTLATQVEAIQQPGSEKLAFLYREAARNAREPNPDSLANNVRQFIDDTVSDTRSVFRTGTSLLPWIALAAVAVVVLKR